MNGFTRICTNFVENQDGLLYESDAVKNHDYNENNNVNDGKLNCQLGKSNAVKNHDNNENDNANNNVNDGKVNCQLGKSDAVEKEDHDNDDNYSESKLIE